jgi:UDP-glucose 4-epimerase
MEMGGFGMKKVLVTGSEGFIGKFLVKSLIQDGYEVWGVDLREGTPNENYHYVQTSIEDDIMEELVKKVDFIIHLAAIATPITYIENPRKTIEVNVLWSMWLALMAGENGKPFVFASSSEVYGVNPELPWSEDSQRVLGPPQEDRWCYSTGKAMVEHYLRALHKDDPNFKYLIVRLFNVYGKGLKGRVFDYFFSKIRKKEPVIIYGDGEQIRCFTYIDDMVDALMKLIDKGCWNDVFNIGNPEQHTINEIVWTIGDIMKKEVFAVHQEHKFPDITQRVPDISKIKNAIDWQPETSLRAGLIKTMKAERLI